MGRFTTGQFDSGASEIVAYDSASHRAFVVNAQAVTIDILDLTVPSSPSLDGTIDITPFGAVANSVAVQGGIVAVAVEASVKQDPGRVVFFDSAGLHLADVEVGPLPDMVTFTPDGRWVLVANEGEPNDDYSVDPEGSVSVIDVSGGLTTLSQSDVRTAGFGYFNHHPLGPSVRIFGPNATPAQDFEPEFIATGRHSSFAWVSLQENNALAILHIPSATIVAVRGLGFKNHAHPGRGMDASNRDGGIRIRSWPVLGMYQPDAIASYSYRGFPLLLLANEGDSRDYSGFSEEARVGDLVLDSGAFPDAAALQRDENLGRLKTTTSLGDVDGDGDFDRIYSYGARSFSIRTFTGHLLWDSGDWLERITAQQLPGEFNSTNDENGSFDDRSDDKGPEPEGITSGKIEGRTYAFVGLERIGGIAVFDITDPFAVGFVQYVNPRDFTGDPESGTAGDLGPEGLLFVPAAESPTGRPMLLVGNEVSGTTTVYDIATE